MYPDEQALLSLTCTSYPETNRLSLEEIDYLFITDGNEGAKKLFSKAGPVKESLKPREEIRRDRQRAGSTADVTGEEKYGDVREEMEHKELGEDDEKSSR